MNGRKAKALRRAARENSVGMPDRGLVRPVREVEIPHRAPQVREKDPESTERVPYPATAYTHPKTTRGIYRELKRAAVTGAAAVVEVSS